MITIETILFWCGLGAAFVVIWKYVWKPFWSAEARANRRRMRSHGRVTRKRRGPAVRLAVRD